MHEKNVSAALLTVGCVIPYLLSQSSINCCCFSRGKKYPTKFHNLESVRSREHQRIEKFTFVARAYMHDHIFNIHSLRRH